MLLTMLAALAALMPASCGVACQARRSDAALAVVVAKLPRAIEGIADEIGRPAGDVAAWKKAASEVTSLGIAYRDVRCDPGLLRYEGGRQDSDACRIRISRAAAADLRFRYQLDRTSFARADVETPGTAARKSPEDEGPCADAPPAECDYCGINHCWEARLKAADARLNAVWRRALARIAAKPGLSGSARRDWTRRLRRAQQAWLRWRDADCELERLETPNPNAHSIFSLVTGPCIAGETEARTAVLARAYGR